MHAVGADERIAAHHGAVLELQRHTLVVLREAAAARTESDRIGLGAAYCARQHVEEIGPVDREVRGAIALDRHRPEIEELPGLAGLPVADLLALRLAGERLQLLTDAERMQHPGPVRRELHARADFLQLGRLLVHLDIDAVPQERERRRQAEKTTHTRQKKKNKQ